MNLFVFGNWTVLGVLSKLCTKYGMVIDINIAAIFEKLKPAKVYAANPPLSKVKYA